MALRFEKIYRAGWQNGEKVKRESEKRKRDRREDLKRKNIKRKILKNRGITFFETIISLALISIFAVILFPILKSSQKTTEILSNISIVEKDSTRISNMIKRSLKNSRRVTVDYEGRELVKDGVIVIDEKRSLVSQISISTLSRGTDIGNSLFLEYPQSDGNKIKNRVIFFQFLSNSLYVTLGEIRGGKIYVEEFEKLYEGNIEGSFEKISSGVVIRFEILKKNSDEKLKVVEYENFN